MRTAGGTTALLLLGLAALAAEATSDRHEKFVPLVAFQCGFRNRFLNANGTWSSDTNENARCMSGKLDILKYCKKSYPTLNVTNIVEYSHEVTLADWCKEEKGDQCRYTQTVRPYNCIVGEFHSEALQVPHNCRFNHENSRDSCNDYNHWKKEAGKLCGEKKDTTGGKMAVRSFAMLEPCGLDMFTGVEFVCCPADSDEAKALEPHDEKKAGDEEEDDSEYDDEEYDEDDKDALKEDSRDQYFKKPDASLAQEHENYREALERVEQRHRVKVNKVMKEWNELDARYNKMKKSDPKGAETFRKEMTNRFQTTVASLEDENRKAKKEIENVHEERVQSAMNEKKRKATHEYRQALAESVGAPNKHLVLKTLKAYIKSEEKDRIHSINRFRHLLRSDPEEAGLKKDEISHKLRYIDLRINGTIAMLRDFPDLEAQIKTIILAFWSDFRSTNMPELTSAQVKEIEGLEAPAKDNRLMDMLVESYEKINPNFDKETFNKAIVTAGGKVPATTPAPQKEVAKVLPTDAEDSEEDADSYYEDENDEEVKKGKKTLIPLAKVEKAAEEEKKEAEKIVRVPIVRPAPVKEQKKEESGDSDDDDEDDSEEEEKKDKKLSKVESDDVSDESDEKELKEKELRVDIEPIIEEKNGDRQEYPAFYRQEKLNHHKGVSPFSASGYVFVGLCGLFCAFVVIIALRMRDRRRHHRFIEVDVCSPEERHVNGMQVTGYENPTYSFFDSKA